MATNRSRTEQIMFWVTPEEKTKMRELANQVDLSLSDYARKVMLGKLALNYDRLHIVFDEGADNG